jgi:hypothetical protein
MNKKKKKKSISQRPGPGYQTNVMSLAFGPSHQGFVVVAAVVEIGSM